MHAGPCVTLHASLCSARAWNADFVLGMDMRVQQVGSALEHLVPELHPGVHVKEALQVRASSDTGQLLVFIIGEWSETLCNARAAGAGRQCARAVCALEHETFWAW